MFRLLRFLLSGLLVLLPWSAVRAHDGLENETEIRVRKDRIDITLRTSMLFAWKLLGDKAPADAGQASQEKVRPLLKEKAAGLVSLTVGDRILQPRRTDCVFELDEHAAFLLVYDMPPDEPEIRFRARFFELLGGVDEGSFRLIDLTRDAATRDAEPLARKRLHRVDDAFSFRCTRDGVRISGAARPPQPAPAR